MRHARALFLFLALAVATALPQQNSGAPTITYDRFWEAATPQNVTLTLESTGKAKYVSRNPKRPAPEGEDADPDYVLEFTMSPENSDRLFQLAKEANYFDGSFDYSKHRVASTGLKTVSYADAARRFQTQYNWSENKSIEQFTRLMEGVANTIEHGRKLQFKYRFDKLGLEAELKGMEEMAQREELAEIQIIAPLLQKMSDDTSVLHIARQRARRLLGSLPQVKIQ